MKVVPEKGATNNTIDHLIDIFKEGEKRVKTLTEILKVLQKTAWAQKVQSDKAELEQN